MLSTTAAERLITRHGSQTRAEAVRPLSVLRAAEQADRVRVRWRRGMIATITEEPAGRVALSLADKTIRFPTVCLPALQELSSGRNAEAAALPGVDAADGTVLIRRLLREGVLVPSPAQQDHA